jgi:hypothetical protein
MERRNFLGLALGLAAGAALGARAQAAPFSPQPLVSDGRLPELNHDAHPAVTSTAEVDRLKPEEVRWGHHGHWHGRHWGWHHRHWGWRRRHWGWRHRWHRHHWRHW